MQTSEQNSVVLTGASGLVGRAITRKLDQRNQSWKGLSRGSDDWRPEEGFCSAEAVSGASAVIHLAGEPIAARRWSETQKKRIRDSRVKGTRALAEAVAKAEIKPGVLVCASATGWYGNRGEESLTESSDPGEEFLSEVVKEWEAAADPAREAGIRVVHLRLSMVLDPKGGALAKMLPAFRLGLGGRVGQGRQWMSWVHREDAASAFVFALDESELSGSYNLTSPRPLRNQDFTKTLGQTLRRPTAFPAPAPLLKLVLGEMAEALLLSSTRALPTRLQDSGFTFQFPDLDSALDDLLNPNT